MTRGSASGTLAPITLVTFLTPAIAMTTGVCVAATETAHAIDRAHIQDRVGETSIV